MSDLNLSTASGTAALAVRHQVLITCRGNNRTHAERAPHVATDADNNS